MWMTPLPFLKMNQPESNKFFNILNSLHLTLKFTCKMKKDSKKTMNLIPQFTQSHLLLVNIYDEIFLGLPSVKRI